VGGNILLLPQKIPILESFAPIIVGFIFRTPRLIPNMNYPLFQDANTIMVIGKNRLLK
jgi:hypothetical protein